MTAPAPIPKLVETYDEIPARLRPAYDLSPLGGYEPNQIGAAIGAYRAALAKDPHREPPAPLRKMTREEWRTLLAIVEQNEKGYFMRAFTAKRIKLTD